MAMRLEADEQSIRVGDWVRPVERDHDDIRVSDRGFYVRRARLRFENGWCLSVVWGTATYSSNYEQYGTAFTETPSLVEIAAMNDRLGTGLVEWEGDTVRGHVPVSELPEIAALIDRQSSDSPVLVS